MSNAENPIVCFIKKTTFKKQYLEGWLEKLSEFVTATTKVDGLQPGCFDGVLALIQQITSEVEEKSDLIENLKKYTSPTLSDSSIGRLKRPVAEQSSSAANETSIGQKKPRNHEEYLSALKQAHQKKCQQLVDDQKNLLGYIIELQTNNHIISQNPVANMDTELEEIARKCKEAQSQYTALTKQLKMENEKLRFNVNRYVAQYMVDKDFNQNIVTIKTTDSIESYLHASQIKQRLEIIEYVDKNLTDDQLTEETLDHLDESSQQKPFKEPVTVALFKQMKDLRYLIIADNKLKETVYDRVDIIKKLTKLIGQEEANGNWQKAERYKQMISGKEQDLDASLEQAVKNRRLYATKYCPEQKDNFVDENLEELFDDLIAEANDQQFFTSKKTLRDRLRHLTKTLSEEYDQIITSIEPTSNSTSCSGLADTLVSSKNIDSKNDQVVVQVIEDVNAGVANDEKVNEQT